MARKPRIHFIGAVYHVILRGANGQGLFNTVTDRRTWEAFVKDGTERFGHLIHGYCWGKDHVQIAIEVRDAPLSKVMQNLTFRYTRHFNTTHGRTGPLFHGRYKAIVVDADKYLVDLVSYIHNGPVRSHAAKRAADSKWTSYAGYADKDSAPDWLSTKRVLDAFGKENKIKTDKAARRAFEKYIDASRDQGYRADLERGSEGSSAQILGDKKFIRKALKPTKEKPRPLNENQLVKRICKFEGIKEAALTTDSRARAESQVRQIITYLAVELNVASMTAMANRFNRDLTTMSRNQRYFREKLATDKPLQKHLKKLGRDVVAD